MKKPNIKRRWRDVRRSLLFRKNRHHKCLRQNHLKSLAGAKWLHNWFETAKKNGLNAQLDTEGRVSIFLPEIMNFSSHYEETCIHLNAIRVLATKGKSSPRSLRLSSVNFNNLKKISTSAALVLTAELSLWDDSTRKRLRARTETWDPEILARLTDLGFFELFSFKPEKSENEPTKPNLSLVKYIKGMCGDISKTIELREKITSIVGDKINHWTFLYSGLSEAITNVSHHAYPDSSSLPSDHKNWYLSASYNHSTCDLKVVFYDQGIGIPRSLPSSKIWERVLSFLSTKGLAGGKSDETLLRAAVEMDRTRTGDNDRGKGLQDLLDFIKRRGDGYLSILSQRGLYKFSIESGKAHIKTQSFKATINGTLIIWRVTLNHPSLGTSS